MKLVASWKGNLKAAGKRGDTVHDIGFTPPLLRRSSKEGINLDPAIFTRRVFKDVLSSVLSREEERREDPLPGEDTRHFSDIGFTILHLSKLRSRCR